MKNYPKTRNRVRLFYSSPIFTTRPEFMALPMNKKRLRKYKDKALDSWRVFRNRINYNF